MFSSKKRKLDVPSNTPPLSAVAARRAAKKSSIQATNINNRAIDKVDSSIASDSVTSVLQSTKRRQDVQESCDAVDLENTGTESGSSEVNFKLDRDGPSVSFESRADSPEMLIDRPSMTLSTFQPSKETLKEVAGGVISLYLAPGERLVILGQYGISVQKGQVTLLGSTLKASKTVHRVYTPSSHSLPVIRCLATDVDDAEIRLHQYESGLRSLLSLSPLFGKLWNDNSGPLGAEHSSLLRNHHHSSFQILFSSKEGPQRSFLQPLISPPEWNEAISKLAGSSSKTPSIMLCGPKSSGKSTFAKILANRLLSAAEGAKKPTGVVILDLDPGQPEYSPPGQISLLHIQEPNFGPPFSHPTPGSKTKIFRSHAIGAVSPSLDPSLYMACAVDLFAQYRNLLSTVPSCPIVINTPGWVLGTGLEILVDLIAKIRPTEVVYMSQDGPTEVVASLREAGKSIPLFILPSQGSEYATRTAAHLRTMQTMSYFHLDSRNKKALAWKHMPLTSEPPWQVSYSGEDAGILGIICYGEQPPANLLADKINGSLVAVVVIDDMAAIPSWDVANEAFTGIPRETDEPNATTMEDAEIRMYDEETFHPHHLEKPLIVRTPDEDLPYFNPANSISLDPKLSHTIGLALVRGIDVARHVLQILTPISPSVISEVNHTRKSIVLISGKLDTPGWAYAEELIQKNSLEKAARQNGTDMMSLDEEEDEEDVVEDEERPGRSLGEGFHNAPWIERLHGSQGRGIGARVWRVRRDLGRTGDGGD